MDKQPRNPVCSSALCWAAARFHFAPRKPSVRVCTPGGKECQRRVYVPGKSSTALQTSKP